MTEILDSDDIVPHDVWDAGELEEDTHAKAQGRKGAKTLRQE